MATYVLEYTKIDAAGNTGNTVNRTVNVLMIDTTAPDTLFLSSGSTVASGSTLTTTTANIAFESTE